MGEEGEDIFDGVGKPLFGMPGVTHKADLVIACAERECDGAKTRCLNERGTLCVVRNI